MIRRALPALFAATLLVACSAGTSQPAASPSPSTSVTASVATPTPAPAVASADPAPTSTEALASAATSIGCTGWVQSAEVAPFADRWGTCDLAGSRVQLYVITGDEAWASFLASVKAYGVTEAQMVRVGDVVAAPADQTKLDAIRTALGG